jgi:hypothetical protein
VHARRCACLCGSKCMRWFGTADGLQGSTNGRELRDRSHMPARRASVRDAPRLAVGGAWARMGRPISAVVAP